MPSGAQLVLDRLALRVALRRKRLGKGLATRRVVRVRTAAAPDMAKYRLHHPPVRRATGFGAGERQAQQRDRIEGVHRWRLQHGAVLARQPLHVAERPGTLGFDFGRALVAPVLQQPGKQHRPILNAVRQTGQGLGKAFERQIGVRRHRVEPESQQLHCSPFNGRSSGVRRCARRSQTARLAPSSSDDHCAISSIVRWQPSHQPVRGSMRQTSTQGLGTAGHTSETSGLGDIGHRRADQRHQLIRAGLEHRIRVPRRGPDAVEAKQLAIHQRERRDEVRERRHPADRKPAR